MAIGFRGLLTLGAAVLSGCAWTVRLPITRPAMINASRIGNTFTVGAVEGGQPWAAERVRSDLVQRIANSLNQSVRLVDVGGSVLIGGVIHLDQVVESMGEEARTCTREVPAGTNDNGTTRYRTVRYPCATLRRRAHGSARIEFRVVNATSNELIYDRVFSRERDEETTGFASAYELREPPTIDGVALLSNMNDDIVDSFAKVILPWREWVKVEFEKCAGNRACAGGFSAVEQGQLALAEQQFTYALEPFDAPGANPPPGEVARVAEALYNRGVVRGFLGRYPEAVGDIQRAISMRPDRELWRDALHNVQVLAENEAVLRDQGAASVP